MYDTQYNTAIFEKIFREKASERTLDDREVFPNVLNALLDAEPNLKRTRRARDLLVSVKKAVENYFDCAHHYFPLVQFLAETKDIFRRESFEGMDRASYDRLHKSFMRGALDLRHEKCTKQIRRRLKGFAHRIGINAAHKELVDYIKNVCKAPYEISNVLGMWIIIIPNASDDRFQKCMMMITPSGFGNDPDFVFPRWTEPGHGDGKAVLGGLVYGSIALNNLQGPVPLSFIRDDEIRKRVIMLDSFMKGLADISYYGSDDTLTDGTLKKVFPDSVLFDPMGNFKEKPKRKRLRLINHRNDDAEPLEVELSQNIDIDAHSNITIPTTTHSNSHSNSHSNRHSSSAQSVIHSFNIEDPQINPIVVK